MKLCNRETSVSPGSPKGLTWESDIELRAENEEKLMERGMEVGVRKGKILPVI